jgi:hypothetical protein
MVIALLKDKWVQAGPLAKRGILYTTISLAGLMYELVWDKPVKWFAIIIWMIILGIGVYLLLFMSDRQK